MFLSAVVAACVRQRWLVLALGLLLALGGTWAVASRLGVTTDTDGLFSASLPWKQRGAELQRAFPQNEDLLVVAIDAKIPEQAEATAQDLAAALAADNTHFSAVSRPDASPYLQRNAFLFLDEDKLRDLLDRTIDAQPFLGQLSADPSLRGLCAALGLIAEGVKTGQADLAAFLPALRAFHDSLASAADGKVVPLSWQRLLAGPAADLAGRYRFVLAKPRLDYRALEPGAAAGDAVRVVASRLEFVRDGSARARLTGSVALNDEEFSTVAEGAAAGLIGSAILVTIWLFLAVRSWRMIVPILLTLLLGLLLTGGFAALAVGTLNLVSVAFAILFLGIAVDFAIQFCVRLREVRLEAPDLATALSRTGSRAGLSILVAALTTATGFLAFTPTNFIGVAQLGLIAGIGMLIAFACTMTFLPATLALFRPVGETTETGLRLLQPLDGQVIRWRWFLLAAFGGLAVLGVVLIPHLGFDGDPLHTKNANTEAMRTLNDLIDDPVTSPYSMELLAPDHQIAASLTARLSKLPDVDSVVWLNSFLPADQDRKLPLIADAAELMRATLTPTAGAPAVTPEALLASIRGLADKLKEALPRLAPDHPLAQIAADLTRLGTASDETLRATDSAMTRFLPAQLDLLRQALSAKSVTDTDIPPDIRRDWVAPDGRFRLQVFPKSTVRGTEALRAFVAEVQAVAPDSAGSAVTIVRSADSIIDAFRTAVVSALIAIGLILVVVLRRALDVALVLAPLLLSLLLSVAIAVVLPLPLNFANVIAVPLLLGLGVSFNIYFVMNWRAGRTRPLGSATARAIIFSALTTASAFGSLALSDHPGTASLGALLLLSLACTACATLLFLPALLAVLPRPDVVPAQGESTLSAERQTT